MAANTTRSTRAMTVHHFRVIVRGMFDDLDDERRERLRAVLDEHDILRSGSARPCN